MVAYCDNKMWEFGPLRDELNSRKRYEALERSVYVRSSVVFGVVGIWVGVVGKTVSYDVPGDELMTDWGSKLATYKARWCSFSQVSRLLIRCSRYWRFE